MASNTINQGAVNGIVIKPIWGTLDKQEEDDSADRFIAIVDSIKKLLDSKADIDHNHDDRYYTEPEIDTKLLAIDVEISQINSKLTPMYGYCETAASVAAKTVTIANFTLVTGRTVYIKFEHENSADDPTLNISGTGAIRIVRYGTDPVSEQEIQWSDGEVKCFTYDGISWIESGGAGGGSDRSDTISFHDSDMIVEPGTNRITFDDSDMIIHPPDGAAWLERTMEALEGGISIISTNNEHAAISNGQYVYIRMHETLPDGLYKATDDIAQDAELSALNVISAAGALNDKSNVGHTHDDRYYTQQAIDSALNEKLSLSGGTMTGTLTINGNNLYLRTTGSSSDDSGDIGWFYGNGQEKMRIWSENEYTAKSGPKFRLYKKDGTALFSGSLSLSDHTHDDRYYTESEMNTKLNAKENTLTYQEINIASLVSSGVSCSSAYIIKYGAMAVIRVNGLKRSSSGSGWTEFFNLSTYLKPSVVYQGTITNDSKAVDGGYIAAECHLNTDGKFRIYAPIANNNYWGSLVVINK